MIHKGSSCWEPSSQIFQAGDLTQCCTSGVYAEILIGCTGACCCFILISAVLTVRSQISREGLWILGAGLLSAPPVVWGPLRLAFGWDSPPLSFVLWEFVWMDVISSSLLSHLCPFCSWNLAAVLLSFCDTDRRVHLSEFLLLQHRLKLGLCALQSKNPQRKLVFIMLIKPTLIHLLGLWIVERIPL